VFGANTTGMRSRFLDEIPDELLDEAPRSDRFGIGQLAGGVHPATSIAGAATAMGRGRSEPGAWASASASEVSAASAFHLGEDVVHAAFGEGVVTGVEPDGVIVVRFADDGSERKLMAEYAPVSRR
jgi:DNA helicase-2/ATP-dependent DNA helicase PcrA